MSISSILLRISGFVILILASGLLFSIRKYRKEVERHRKIEEELQVMIQTFEADSKKNLLTGLPSRPIFEDRLQQLVTQGKRYNLLFAVLFLDLNHFKKINDGLGLEAGDIALKEAARRLHTNLRQLDTVYHFASDEFLILLPQISVPETSAYVAQRLLNAIAKPFQIDEQEVFITASIGIAVYPHDGEDSKTIVNHAEMAMQQAKVLGENNYSFYEKGLYNKSQRELALIASLHSVTVYQDFVLYYQPQFNAQTNKIYCMETILYWKHPEWGLIEFNDFVRFAESSGNILSIGDWTLRHACQQFQKWELRENAPESIAVKVTLRQLENPHFIYKLSQLLQELHFDPSCLILEISEGSLTDKVIVTDKTLSMLKQLGVRISMVDFGLGSLALRHLRRFPVDNIKIDKAFIENITVNKDSETIVKMIIVMASTLGMQAIVAGVDNHEQARLLKDLGCYLMQGELFSKPMIAEELDAVLENV